ncbi:MAG: dicarboxylate/amino acid:cation symporter [Gemmatimonadota bacterium]|nr:dicarboxylate/amino acid:cation symporter [Gemmatimonadota bacterium]
MKLHTKIVVGLLAGALTGTAVNAAAGGATWLVWVNTNVANPVGQVFLRMLFMTVVPLVFASLTLGVAGIGNVGRLGRIGVKTLAYFLASTALSTVVGLVLVSVFDPGGGIDQATRQDLLATYQGQAEGMQLGGGVGFGVSTFVNMIPRNPVQAAAAGDMLAVIFFALVFGAALIRLPNDRAQPMLGVVGALADVVMVIIEFAMKLAPYGVFALIFGVTSRFGWHLLGELGWYVVVVVVGLLVHGGVSLSLLVRVFGGMNPIEFWHRSRTSLITAFSTSSSNATLPTTIAVAEHQLGVPPTIAGFVLPLGATMNMNGTALYEGVTVLFLAQVFGVDLTLAQQVVVLVLSVLTAVGTAGVPGGSLPLMMVVLATVGVPAEGIAIILGVDRILDMCRTTLNVAGDLTAAVFVARTEPVVPDVAMPEAPVAVA